MNLRQLEIGSWKVHELWTEQWPAIRPMLLSYLEQWRMLRRALQGEVSTKGRGYVRQLLHEAMDVVTETIRLTGRAVAIFAYTISHVLVTIAGIWVVIWIVGRVG